MEEKDRIVQIPVEDILPNRFQPRLAFDENELNELSNSIVKYGVIQPIVLRKMGDKYEIIAGERRYKATVLAGLKTIPAIINDTDDNTSAEIALLENIQRKNLSVIEEAQSFKKLMDRGFKQDEIANRLGISQSSIANKIRLLNLPRKVQDALLYNKISERHARSLLSLNNSELQLDLLNKIIENKLTVKQTEDEISKLLNKPEEIDDIPAEIKRFLSSPNNPEKIEEKQPEVVNIELTENKDENEGEINPFQERFENSLKQIEANLSNQDEHYYDEIIDNDLKNNFNFVELSEENQNILKNEMEEIPEEELETIELSKKEDEKVEEQPIEKIETENKVQNEEKIQNEVSIQEESEIQNETKEIEPIKIEEIEPLKNEEIKEEKESINLPKTISEIRDYIKGFDNKNITLSELDFPDKYQIIIEIDKN